MCVFRTVSLRLLRNSMLFQNSPSRSIKVNETDGCGRTALHYAAERDVICTAILLEHGASINASDADYDTALHWAVFKSNEPCVQFLLKNGANVDAEDFNCNTPLNWAARKGNLGIIRLLLDYNACVKCKNLLGLTALHRVAAVLASGAFTNMDNECMELLLKAAGQFDFRSENGELSGDLTIDSKLCETFLSFSQNVRPLQSLCLYAVRQTLGRRYLPNVVPKIPLPKSLKDFILLQK